MHTCICMNAYVTACIHRSWDSTWLDIGLFFTLQFAHYKYDKKELVKSPKLGSSIFNAICHFVVIHLILCKTDA